LAPVKWKAYKKLTHFPLNFFYEKGLCWNIGIFIFFKPVAAQKPQRGPTVLLQNRAQSEKVWDGVVLH